MARDSISHTFINTVDSEHEEENEVEEDEDEDEMVGIRMTTINKQRASFRMMDFDELSGAESSGWARRAFYSSKRSCSRFCTVQKQNGIVGVLLAILVLLVLALLLVQIIDHSTRNSSHVTLTGYNNKGNKDPYVCLTPDCVQVAAKLLDDMNTSADPCNDFYNFACGGWIKRNEIPVDEMSWTTFSSLHRENLNTLKRLLETPFDDSPLYNVPSTKKFGDQDLEDVDDDDETIQKPPSPILSILKAKSYYESCMNTKLSNKKWHKIELDQIFSVFKNTEETNLEDILNYLHLADVNALFKTWVMADQHNPTINTVYIAQDGLGLEDPALYNRTLYNETLFFYEGHIARMFLLLGVFGSKEEREAKEAAKKVIKLESDLSKSFVATKMKDPLSTYNPFNITEMTNLSNAEIDWKRYFEFVFPLVNVTQVIVQTPSYIRKLGKILKNTDRDVLIWYSKWQAGRRIQRMLNSKVEEEAEKMHNFLTGANSFSSRWVMCVLETEKKFSLAVGRLFVDENFSGSEKAAAKSVLEDIIEEMSKNFKHNPWMDKSAKKIAKKKAEHIQKNVGYPSYIFNNTKLDELYKRLNVRRNTNFVSNALAAARFHRNQKFATHGKKVDRSVWDMGPSTIKSAYIKENNEIFFPAGILRAPFFSNKYPKSLNYGGFGMLAGHELTHSYDLTGRAFDDNGYLRDWWGDNTKKNYYKHSQCFASEYGKFQFKNGKGDVITKKTEKTLREDIADNSGIQLAYNAYRKWVKKNGEEATLPGLEYSNDQLLFINFGRLWCAETSANAQVIRNDPHSSPLFRVMGSIRNFDQFTEVFKCPKDSVYGNAYSKKCTF